jgi:hypothetical protein
MLEHESGYQLEVAPVGDFESAILGARWDEAVGLMDALGLAGSSWEPVSPFVQLLPGRASPDIGG